MPMQVAVATLPDAQPTKTIADRVAEALEGPVPKQCPFEERVAAGATLYDVPEKARKLGPLWEELKGKADRVSKNGNDGGVWYRRILRANAIRTLIEDIIHVEHEIENMRISIGLHADWKYSRHGF